VDFAYALHTDLGHRCRGAKVDGQLVPLNTPLQSGQTVEITAVKEGGPSMDWLNPELGFLKSQRSRAKVRAWFNAQAMQATIARGRELVEKLLQREGKTAMKLDHLAEQLGFKRAEDLFEVVGKDEFSLRTIENFLRPAAPAAPVEAINLRAPRSSGGGVLVVGVDSLMTSLAACCRPAPPDAIRGFVTRGKGVAIHRADCSNFGHMTQQHPERELAVAWGQGHSERAPLYALDVLIEASERQSLLRDVSEVFFKEKLNVVGMHTQGAKDSGGAITRMSFTIELDDVARLPPALAHLMRVPGVRMARRR
jgi:GTP pyrophosphokinase